MTQAVPGHKRAPSDVSVASSEDDKAAQTPSTLESVTEKTEAEPAADRTSDKLSDEGLGTSEVDKTEEEKLNEVSDASNEDLASPTVEPTKGVVSQDLTEDKPVEEQGEVIPEEPVVAEPEENLDSLDLYTDGQTTEEEEKETQEEKAKDEPTQQTEEEIKPEDVKEQEEKEKQEAGTDELTKSQEQPEDTREKPEPITVDVAQAGEDNKEQSVEPPQHIVTVTVEDTVNVTDANVDKENIESNLKDTNVNGETESNSTVDPSTDILIEKQTKENQPGEKPENEAPEEAEQPEQDNQTREKVELEKEATTASTNGVSDEVKATSEEPEPVEPSQDIAMKEDEDKSSRVDETTSQDAVSVPESETDSETKTEQGSPAVIKPDLEKDSDSGSSSAADTNSLDLNLSISSFLSKSKEGGSISMQVT